MGLKELLFRRTHEAFVAAERAFTKCGDDAEPQSSRIFGEFYALHSLVEDAGLYDEYHEWEVEILEGEQQDGND